MSKFTLYYALDISSDLITAAKAAVDKSGKILDLFYYSCPAKGIKEGAVREAGLLSENIEGLLGRLSVSSNDRVRSLYVTMRSLPLAVRHSVGMLPISERSNKIITLSDVSRVNKQAYNLGLSIDEEVLYSAAQWYTLDNQSQVLNPVGLYSNRLGVDFLMVMTPYSGLQNLISAVETAGTKIKAVVLSSLASSFAVVPLQAKAKGCYLLDVGFDSTQLLLFTDNILRGLEIFNFGSRDITRALAEEFKIPFELAEDIKLSYGRISANDSNNQQEILIRHKDNNYKAIKCQSICRIIESKLEYLLNLLQGHFCAYSKTPDTNQGLILSGKDILLEGFIERMEASLGLPVKLARIEDSPVRDISCAAFIGLIKYAAATQGQIDFLKLSMAGSIFQKISGKLKELYHEYL